MKTVNLLLFVLSMLLLLSCRSSDDDPSEFYLQGSITDPNGNPITGAEVYLVFDDISGGASASKDPTTVSEIRYRYTDTQMMFYWTTTFELNLTEFNILQGNPANHQVINSSPIIPTNNASGSTYTYTHGTIIQDEFWLEAKDTYGMEQHLGPFNQYLPVELSSFTASVNEYHQIVVNWTTQSETELLGFYVLRGVSNELVNAYPVSPLINAFNEGTAHTYTFTDSETEAGNTYYYWLEVVEFDGGSIFHGPVSVHIEEEEPPPLPVVLSFSNPYPNPAVSSTNFQIAVPDSINVRVRIRRAGLNETLKEFTVAPGNHTLLWNCTDMNGNKVSNGCYVATCNATSVLSGDMQAQIIKHFLVNDPSLSNAPAVYSDGNGYKLPVNTAFLWEKLYYITDPNGNILTQGTLPHGVTVYVKKKGYETASQHINLALDHDNVLNFILQPLSKGGFDTSPCRTKHSFVNK